MSEPPSSVDDMFEDVAADRVLSTVRAHAFDHELDLVAGGELVDAIVALDRAIAAAQAAQAEYVADLLDRYGSGSSAAALATVAEVSLARTIGPTAAGNQLALGLALRDLPLIAERFRDGRLSEPVVRAVVRETAALDADDLILADAELAARLAGLTVRKAGQLAARVVVAMDPEAAHERAETHRRDAYVAVDPLPDGVATLYAVGPAEQIVAAYQALDSWATGARSTGDPRTRGQIMCQTLVERVTGLTHAADLDIEIGLVMDAATLTATDHHPVELDGYGPLSPDVADEIIARAPNASIRRLLTDPVDGTLVAQDPRRRRFDGVAARHIKARDRGGCRQPGCDRQARHLDHIHAYADGGATVTSNGQGLCTRSHTFKHLPGFSVRAEGHTTVWRTPTGHEYRSKPPLLGMPPTPGRLRQ